MTTTWVLAAVILLPGSWASAVTWNDPAGGGFFDGLNWSGGVAPSPATFALFDLGGQTYTVNFTATAANTHLIIGRDDVTFDLAGFAYNLTRVTEESIFVGEIAGDDAVLRVTNGTLNGIEATLGQVNGSIGQLNLPTGASLILSDLFRIGESGTGSMNVTGGKATTTDTLIGQLDGGVGDVLLSGSGSLWTNTNTINMGAGDTSLTVQNGARLDTTNLTVGSAFSSIADVVLDGPGSQINVSSSLTLGNIGGTTTFTVRNGADLTSGKALIGNLGIGNDSRMLVTGAGSTWVSTDKISASLRGDAPGGLLEIQNGAVVSSVAGAIGELADSEGEAAIDGAGSQWNMSGDLLVGQGKSTLSITNGGVVNNTNGEIGTADATRPIHILVNGTGSQWNNTGALTGGTLATMTINDGGKVTSDSVSAQVEFMLDGPGSSWEVANLFSLGSTFGGATPSTSTISNGAVLTSDGGDLINTVDLRVDGGSWNNSGTLTLNSVSNSRMHISNGGIVTNFDATLVSLEGRNADVIVEGAGSQWETSGNLTIGGAEDGFGSGGIAELTVRDGGFVYSDDAAAATVATAQSTILLEGSGSRWSVGGNLTLGGSDSLTAGGTADMTIASGATAQVLSTLKVHTGSHIQLLGGTLEVSSDSAFDMDQADGLDFVFGTLRYTGNAVFNLSYMQKLLGTVPTLGTAKSLEVNGIATLNTGLIIDGGSFSAGQLQGSVDPLFINGTLSLTNDSLTIGAGGLLGTNLTLQSDRVLNIGNSVIVNAGSVLTIDQTTMTAGSLTNNGEVVLNGASAYLGGGSLDNSGRLTGNGRLGLGLSNAAGGVVLVTAGNHLIAEGGQNFNSGRIDLTGGTIEFTQFTQNNSGGLIAGQGTVISRSSFINDGEMAFSGATNFIGDMTNSVGSLVLVTGVGPTTFFDDLVQNGEVRTSMGATAVYLGTVSGTGTFTGTGTNLFEGDFTPGASPAEIVFEGDVVLTESATLQIELVGGGGMPGTDFDRLDITGGVTLGGTLDISMLGGYVPDPGDSFQIITADSRLGTFNAVNFPTLAGGLEFNLIYYPNGVTLGVITSLPGDLDGDGFVGITDLNIVLSNWNQNVPPANPAADPSGDNFIGIEDLNVVLGNWNAGTPPMNNANIPEPASAGLLLLGSLALLRRQQAS